MLDSKTQKINIHKDNSNKDNISVNGKDMTIYIYVY